MLGLMGSGAAPGNTPSCLTSPTGQCSFAVCSHLLGSVLREEREPLCVLLVPTPHSLLLLQMYLSQHLSREATVPSPEMTQGV